MNNDFIVFSNVHQRNYKTLLNFKALLRLILNENIFIHLLKRSLLNPFFMQTTKMCILISRNGFNAIVIKVIFSIMNT